MKKFIVFIVCFVILLCIVGGSFYYYINKDKENKIENKTEEKKPIVDNVKIVNVNSKTRPYAVSIDNLSSARPQSGLNKAYIVYEIIVEGDVTRLLALFKDVDVSKIGPVRSARMNFVDYALENGAILTHFGGNERAYSDINKYNLNNIDGINLSSEFVRDNKRYAPHNVFTSTKKLNNYIVNKYLDTTNKGLLFKYTTLYNIENEENKKIANNILINYSDIYNTSYKYDVNSKKYLKFANNKAHMDSLDNTQLSVKNIIVLKVGNHNLKGLGSGKGVQELENIGKGTRSIYI
ncbi:MAG: DUF3048 domain-containing protein [Clostridia bacterium]